MDPHSRLSQYNQRQPKTGPEPRNSTYAPRQKPERMEKHKTPASALQRPIATNSRVRQDEKYRQTMYLSFVTNALQQKINGVNENFDVLVGQFKPPSSSDSSALDPSELRFWLAALSHVVSRLERSHAPLVNAIVHLPWTLMDNATVKSYVVFLGMLLSARPEYLSLVLDNIAQGFTYASSSHASAPTFAESSSSPAITRRTVYDRLHTLLSHILSLIPTCPSTLYPLLVRHFPHKRQNQIHQTTYIRNLLRVSDYCSEVSSKILGTIIDRALQIDVEIQVEIEEIEEEETPDNQAVFELDAFDEFTHDAPVEDDASDDSDAGDGDAFSDLSSEGGNDLDDDKPTADLVSSVHHIQDMIQKLDAILTLLLTHLHHPSNTSLQPSVPDLTALPPLPPDETSFSKNLSHDLTPRVSTPTSLDLSRPHITKDTEATPESLMELRRAQFHTLLGVFDRSILKTFKSRYTQFLLFYYCSLDTEFADVFQGMLVSKALLEGDQPAITRAAAASYIGSFVSRALYVDRDAAQRVVGVLCNFLKSHLDSLEASDEKTGATDHVVFYAVTQAVFLVFCFRWQDLLEEDSPSQPAVVKKWIPPLDIMKRVIDSSLNPLKVCSSHVVEQFARAAHATDFLYCYTTIESNKRFKGPNGSRSSTQQPKFVVTTDTVDGIKELNTFFPFDPYRLPKSSVYMEDIFREWKAGNEDESDEESEGDDEDEVEYSHEPRLLGRSVPTKPEDMPLSVSLEAMSISPARYIHK